jgi:serine/threonine protein kinase
MSKPTESLFDTNTKGFTLWRSPNGIFSVSKSDIIFQASLYKMSKKSDECKMRFFVLTDKYLFYLESEDNPKMIAVMSTKWVRVDYIVTPATETKPSTFVFRFVRNMKFTDLCTEDKCLFEEWKSHFTRVFWQCDFHQKFNTIKMIGKGSFARVYMVENKETKKKFAVKAFSKDHICGQNKGKEALMNEIDVMKQLKHPNIMKLEEVHESKNSVYLVLELLEGGELLQFLWNKETLTSNDHVQIMKSILNALAYMAEKNIMHRDLKPDNIILKNKDKIEFNNLKLVDFGLSSVCGSYEQLFKRCGTPGFVAPEVINSNPAYKISYNHKCDVFSAGVIFYILLTERSPFEGKSFKEILEKNKKCKLDFYHAQLVKNKVALDLLKKMLEVNPDKRISAKEALTHEYFLNGNVTIEAEDRQSSHSSGMRIYIESYRNTMKPGNKLGAHSLVMRDPVFTGRTDTINDSFNSKDSISSLKNMSQLKQQDSGNKRDSILKMVLLQNAQITNIDIYGSGFTEEIFDTDDEPVPEDDYEEGEDYDLEFENDEDNY